ncbi:MAG TPA: S9 family peptidase [Ktedonobacterales bacterium]
MASNGNISTYSFERYLNVRTAHGPSFAPDGRTLTFLTNITGVDEVWSVPVDVRAAAPSWPSQLTFRGERVAVAAYSPAAETLLVSADVGGSERTQLYRMSADGAEFSALTDRPETIYTIAGEDAGRTHAWSPDGALIAYASNERDPRYFDVYVRPPADGGAPRRVYQGDGNNYALGFAPDGRSLLVQYVASNTRNQLLLVDLATAGVRPLTPASAEGHAWHAAPAWSADRRALYLLGDHGREFLTLARLDLATAELTYLRDDPWGAEGLAVSSDGARLALALNEDGYSRLELFDVAAGWSGRRPLPGPALPRGVIAEMAWSPDGTRLALTIGQAGDAADIWVWDVAEGVLWRATIGAMGGIPRASLVAPTLVHYPTFDGREIPAYLYLPRGIEPRGLPTVIHVHGGPEGQARPAYNAVMQYLAGQGYAVLVPNVRGSTGYGYTYQSLDDVRLRMDSVADLRHAALWLAESGIAARDRIAVMGGSYGGFMVLAALTTYPDLWAAGVDIVGIANFVTFLEQTGPWRRALREPEYGSLEHDRAFLEEISPIHKVDRIQAPLFVVHGANDPRVPVGEAEQIVAALRARSVPVEYLRFADEGHGLIKRANQLIAYPAIGRFLDRYVKGSAS